MNSVLNLNTTWTARNFLKYIEHSFSRTVANCYDSLDEEGKNALIIMKTLSTRLKQLRKEIKIGFIGTKLNFEEKTR